jgi:ubiquinone/menaquinone biosynthesis C-methylase UbiE
VAFSEVNAMQKTDFYTDTHKRNIKANICKWDKRAKNYEKALFAYFRIMQKAVLDVIDFKHHTNFLDIGCGTGWAVQYAAAKITGRGTIIGLDLSEKMIEKARALSQADNAYYQVADAHTLDFKTKWKILFTRSLY